MNKVGRPKIEITWDQFDKLCAIQCTLEELASFFDCSADTIERAVKREKHVNFAEYYAQKKQAGKISLRRKIYQAAMDGDKTMMIWLSKQMLGYSEKVEQKTETKAEIVQFYLPKNGSEKE